MASHVGRCFSMSSRCFLTRPGLWPAILGMAEVRPDVPEHDRPLGTGRHLLRYLELRAALTWADRHLSLQHQGQDFGLHLRPQRCRKNDSVEDTLRDTEARFRRCAHQGFEYTR